MEIVNLSVLTLMLSAIGILSVGKLVKSWMFLTVARHV